ncbi:MAG: DUF3037 domain-containing protein [Verrucomicrobiales bacterium]|nr:DUF3037 domain-containing protein [Verrucomicrobiales bacterium]
MKTYEFLTLRYLHDAMTGEFINVGVVLRSEDGYLGAYFCPRFTRIKQLFGSLQRNNHKQLIGYLQRHFDKLAEETADELSSMERSLESLAYGILPPDNSAYQWSEIKKGLTADPEEELTHLSARLVTHYEKNITSHRRSDEEVWSAFNKVLREKKIASYFKETQLKTDDYGWTFSHTYKNGLYNIYEPLAFDYDDTSKIAEKAIRWNGRGNALATAAPHKFHFLVGDVEGESRKRATEKALNLLNAIPGGVEIIREHEKESFADDLVGMIAMHK